MTAFCGVFNGLVRLVVVDDLGRALQEAGILQVDGDAVEGAGIVGARADALVHHKADGHALLVHDLALDPLGDFHRVAHGGDHRGRAEFIHVVVDVVRADGGQVRDDHGLVEGTGVHDGLGQAEVQIPEAQERRAEGDETGDLQEDVDDLVRVVGVALHAVGFHVFRDLALDGEDVVLQFELHLVHGAVQIAGLQHDHAHGEFVAGVDLLVHDEAVEVGELRRRAQERRDDQRQVGDLHTFRALLVDVVRHGIEGDVDLDHVLGVVAVDHEIGGNGVHRRNVLDQSSVFTHGQTSSVV